MLRRMIATALAMVALSAPLAAQAAPVTFHADMTGAAEAPPNASPGTGEVTVIFDPTAHTLRVIASFEGLLGNTTAAHIHCCTVDPFAGTAGVATMLPSFSGFPLGVTAGAFDQTYDLTLASSFNPAFVTSSGGIANAEAALYAAMLAGRTYFNVHTSQFGGGEIRGFLQKVPEPGTLALLAVALAPAVPWRRRRAA